MARQTVVERPRKSKKQVWLEFHVTRPIVKAGRKAAFAWRKARSACLVIGGVASIDVGAFQLNTVVGWLVMGLSLLAMDFQSKGTR